MAKSKLFEIGDGADHAYINIRKAENAVTAAARQHCEKLWEQFEHLADKEFLIEIRKNFDARYWEMYLTVTLMNLGFEVTCPKRPGPDVGIEFHGQRIWFEATCPTTGEDNSPDQVRGPVFGGKAYTVPNEQMILRYLNSVSEKVHRQYPKWINAETVSPNDSLVVALNPRGLGHDIADTVPPRILQTAYPLGNLQVTIDTGSLGVVETSYAARNQIAKARGSNVETGVFLQPEYNILGGLLCSRVDACNRPEKLGDDFQFAPNLNAKAPISAEFRLPGTYYRPVRVKSENGESLSVVVEAQ